MQINSAVFEVSAPDLASCPPESLPEFAFIGRSNVGKSSLLNLLAGKLGLARVSATPGFTKLINYFRMNDEWYLVDLPGYGFAQVARENSAKFNAAVSDYLANRESLHCVFVLIDCRHEPQKLDLQFMEWLVDNAVPFVLVFTKTDDASAAKVQRNIALFQERLAAWCEKLPEVFTTSAVERKGRGDLLKLIERALAPEPDPA